MRQVITNKKKPSTVLFYLGLLLALFVGGMLALVGLRMTFQNATDSLNDLASNERIRKEIGNHIVGEIGAMESLFFQLAPVSGLYDLQISAEQFRHHLRHVMLDLDILEKGGVLEFRTLLNKPHADSLKRSLVYKPDPKERYILASIELRPQLPELEKRLEVLLDLLEERTRLGKLDDADAYFKHIKVIQTNLRMAIPLFQRIEETANNLLYDSSEQLERLELEINLKKGQYRLIETSTYVVFIITISGLGIFIAGRIRDVVRKEREFNEEIRRASVFLKTIIESITHPFCVIDLKTFETEISNSAARNDQPARDENKSSEYFLVNEQVSSADKFHLVLDKIEKTGESVSFVETRNQSGKTRFLDHRAYPVYDEGGKVAKLIEYWVDVTEIKEVEQERMMLAAAVEQSEESIVIAKPSGEIHYVNPAFERISGYSKNEVLGRHFLKVTGNAQEEDFYQKAWAKLSEGISWKGQLTSRKKDGTPYQESALISPILSPNGLISNFVAIKRDISLEVELENQVRHAQKMEAVGTLAGGIAHDFNNLLQIILGYTDILIESRQREASELRKLDAVKHAASNGAELVRQLLAFSRKDPAVPEPTDLNKELNRIAHLLKRTIPKMIEVRLNLAKNLSLIEIDSTHFEQVILNLATNARDAMPDGGLFLLETVNVTLDEKFCEMQPELAPGEYVLLQVSDNGHGISRDVIDHIFDPFFSTKEVGKGTGLGLSTVFGIVKAHNGLIFCESEVGAGTTFRIYFPSSTKPLGSKFYEGAKSDRTGSETIMVVDDDHQMRDLLGELLESVGYETISASSGIECLALYQENQNKISLIILDMMMPQMSGKKCLEALLELDPTVKVLISSGHSDDGPISEALGTGAKAFINKPYDIHKMLSTIRNLLDPN